MILSEYKNIIAGFHNHLLKVLFSLKFTGRYSISGHLLKDGNYTYSNLLLFQRRKYELGIIITKFCTQLNNKVL